MKQHERFQAALPQGWRVRFQHERPRVMVYDPPSSVDGGEWGVHRALALSARWVLRSHKGGHTICAIEDASGRVMSVGYAYCSEHDNYCKAVGRELAFERARGSIAQAKGAMSRARMASQAAAMKAALEAS